MLCAGWPCRVTNVKLKLSSSSFGKRMRKDGGPTGDASGSCMHVSEPPTASLSSEYHTCTYSITLSSPNSLFGLYLVAGKALGAMFSSVRFRLLVILSAVTETRSRQPSVQQQLRGQLTAVLVAEEEFALLGPAVDGPHAHAKLPASLPSRSGIGML
jgi:hypothetical protein